MSVTQMVAAPGNALSEGGIRQTLKDSLGGVFRGQRVLVLIPDHTRSLPLPFLFRELTDLLQDVQSLSFLVALGTHPPLDEAGLEKLVGAAAAERRLAGRTAGVFNHDWQSPAALESLGVIPESELRRLAGERWHPSLAGDIEVRINRTALEHDRILIVGPVFPHEVVGFSGGAKYLFPGISGPDMINVTHWLGALAGVPGTIGIRETPVRALIHAAAAKLKTPVTLAACVVEDDRLTGLFVGDLFSAWNAAADLSAQRHIRRCDHPFQRVLSCAPPMYDELWTAAKAMYKLEPVLAPGGELIIYAPHLDRVSHVHGENIFSIGYHILPYFLEHWEQFRHVPLGVLAHSTHVRGSGRMVNGTEVPNLRVTLASRIPPEDCARLGLGYLDPASIRVDEWQNREAEGILYVPKAGEILYRLKEAGAGGRK